MTATTTTASPAGVSIEPLQRSQLAEAADVHVRAFPGYFLSSLGRRFLRLFYEAFLVDDAVAIAAVDTTTRQLLGTAVGSLKPRGFFKRLVIRKWWQFGLAATAAILRKPSTAPRLVRGLFYRGDPPTDGKVRALLSSICVSPDAQGRGLGKALLAEWVEQVRQRDVAGCYLTTDVENNDAVNALYRKLGFEVQLEYTTPEGRKMFRYVQDFDGLADTPAGPSPS